MRRIVRVRALSLLVLLLAPAGLLAEKSLYWKSLDVNAKLDDRAVLHVAEKQAMVFTGDWNGGERKFRVFPGQGLRLVGVSRLDPAAGQMRPLVQGDLSQLDHYAMTDATTLRWRSRLQSDPDFAKTEIVYEIDYELSGILAKEGNTYILDNDFAFPGRAGTIESFTLDLALDPAWKLEHPMPLNLRKGPVPPGQGVVLRAELAFTGASAPSGVRVWSSRGERIALFVVFLAAVLALWLLLFRREAGLGRFEPLPPASEIDKAWLQKNVFSLRPEEVGALWDEAIGAPEVAAVLARLSAEKKIETSADGKKKLTMRLLVPLSSLDGYEKELLEAFFFGGRKETDTDAIRAHYKSSGFDPSSKIKQGLESRLSSHPDFQDRTLRPRRWPTIALWAAGLGTLGALAVFGKVDFGWVVAVVLGAGVLLAAAAAPAYFWQKRMHAFALPALGFLWVPAVFVYLAFTMIRSGGETIAAALAGALLVRLAVVNNLFNLAKTRNGPHRIRRRKTLVAAREFFIRELKSPSPRLEDAWFSYLVAFGLAGGVEKWFDAYGGERAGSAAVASTRSSPASSAGSSGGGWTGGGGSFGGAGASASWAAAAGSLAAGVSAPSSGGSGGGGGGGSSGGGGGG
ncbi:MAG TPA: hypothetical protein VKG01_08025, partial [Thermoanaerobaculia bacterium]|nr:hypothetical protein [Thermoanaerobaculia bacterium]